MNIETKIKLQFVVCSIYKTRMHEDIEKDQEGRTDINYSKRIQVNSSKVLIFMK